MARQQRSRTVRPRANQLSHFPEPLGPRGKGECVCSVTPVCVFPGRFTRHLNIISINAFEDDILTKIFSSIADWHFGKGFDVTFLRYEVPESPRALA